MRQGEITLRLSLSSDLAGPNQKMLLSLQSALSAAPFHLRRIVTPTESGIFQCGPRNEL